VIDWRAPISKLFYGSTAENQAYTSPGGVIHGTLHLKRHYTIEEGELRDIADEVDRRAGKPSGGKMITSEARLLQFLYSRGDPRLQDIVKSIQEQQDRIIRASPQRVLIINGVAGSGKTSIAYHRLTYLLYPDTQANIQANRTIVFAPNRLFLSYVSELLPRLGVREAQQTTFDDWALEKMQLAAKRNGKLHRKYKIQEASLDIFLDRRASQPSRAAHWKRARIKGGSKIQKLLDHYVEYRKNSLRIPGNGLAFKNTSPIQLTLAISAAEIKEVVSRQLQSGLPFDLLRERVVADLISLLPGKFDQAVDVEYNRLKRQADDLAERAFARFDEKLGTEAEELQKKARQFRNRAFSIPEVRRKMISDAAKRLKEDFANTWPAVQLRDDYYGLLANPSLLAQLGSSFLTPEEISLLASLVPAANTIDIEDIPALYYLFTLTQGKSNDTYDHVVIDEAQDFSPLHFHLIRMHSRDGSMTIVGDIAQGIYAHRGLSGWDEIKPTFHNDVIQYEEITQNYRSTREIVLFTNEILKKIYQDQALYAQPFSRPGEKPRMVQTSGKEEMYQAIAQDIQQLSGREMKHIGVIVKSSHDLDEAVGFLQRYGCPMAYVISSRDAVYQYAGGIAVIPAALAKGIEFQAALVVNASEAAYNGGVAYDGRVLYVACTRALHHLGLYSAGPFSSFLEEAKEAADIQTGGAAGSIEEN
jgi:DNA helicase-2/ATP-dependent DNA helicase PcrA